MTYQWAAVNKAQVADTDAINALGAAVTTHDQGMARMGCSLRRVAAQTLPDAAPTAFTWDTEDADTHGLFASGTDITIPAGGGGVWVISVVAVFIAAALTGIGMTQIKIDGGEQARAPFADNGSSVGLVMPLSAGQVITVAVYADTAAGTTMTGAVFCYRVGL